jgi:hypothetical protein
VRNVEEEVGGEVGVGRAAVVFVGRHGAEEDLGERLELVLLVGDDGGDTAAVE